MSIRRIAPSFPPAISAEVLQILQFVPNFVHFANHDIHRAKVAQLTTGQALKVLENIGYGWFSCVGLIVAVTVCTHPADLY